MPGDFGLEILWEDCAVLLNKSILVLGDLHIGLEEDLARSGYRLIRLHRKMLAKILDLLDRTNVDKLVLLGDVKHSIGNPTDNELYQLEEFFLNIPAKTKVVLGNHDGGLRDYLASWGIDFSPSAGYMEDGFYLFHGNAKPREEAKDAKLLIACHWHPTMRIKDKRGVVYQERVWIRVPTTLGPDLLMLPAFNDLLGGANIEDIHETWFKMEEAEIFLTDGVFLGKYGDVVLRK